MKRYATCLTIAGSDPYGGAGIQADLKTFSALGCYGASAITALTIQNSIGVKRSVPVNAVDVYDQATMVFEDIEIDAVKIGMSVNAEVIEAIAEVLKVYHPSIVVLDPVMVSSSGHPLLDEQSIQVLKNKLMPLCTLVTPNLPELYKLSHKSSTIDAAKAVLKETGCKYLLAKGGHLDGEPTDTLINETKIWQFTGKRVKTNNTHGTGCTLSSAIAAFAAHGYELPLAVEKAKEYVQRALQSGANAFIGHGNGSMNHFFNPQSLIADK